MFEHYVVSYGGSSNQIQVKAEEMTHIYSELDSIISTMGSDLKNAIDEINDIEFYKGGKAKDAVDTLKKANGRFLELQAHYQRMYLSINNTLYSMMQKDEELARQIVDKLRS